QPAVNEKGVLVWTNYSANGSRLKKLELPQQVWQLVSTDSFSNVTDIYIPGALKQLNAISLHGMPTPGLTVSRYSKWKNPFNFHSWRPYYEQPDWSFTLYGQNVLNTLQSEAYYAYNENESSSKVGANLLWGSWYPWITGGLSYTH